MNLKNLFITTNGLDYFKAVLFGAFKSRSISLVVLIRVSKLESNHIGYISANLF